MDKIKVSICAGTTCFVMGASEIFLLEEELPDEIKAKVEIEGVTCMDSCKNEKCGKAPFVMINGEMIQNASKLEVRERIEELVAAL